MSDTIKSPTIVGYISVAKNNWEMIPNLVRKFTIVENIFYTMSFFVVIIFRN